MTRELINTYVYGEAGLGFREDGVYYVDYGTEFLLASWDETPWDGPEDYES